MSLGEKRAEFSRHLALLLLWAQEHYDRAFLGEVKREGAVKGGHPDSLHHNGLAGHLELFRRDGSGKLRYLTRTPDYELAGQYWESLHPDNSWGGDFSDGHHFSRRHRGMR